VQRLAIPAAVLLHVRVLVDAVAPLGVLLVLPEHAVVAPARRRALAVLGDEDRGLQRDPFVELAVDQALLPAMEPLQILANALLADVHPVEPELDRAVVGEKIRGFAPEAAIDVETECALQLLDGARGLELLDARGELSDLRFDAGAVALRMHGRMEERTGKTNHDAFSHGPSSSLLVTFPRDANQLVSQPGQNSNADDPWEISRPPDARSSMLGAHQKS